ncbi:AarF/ABC1/UbiB kinase family protein [Paucibacter sp. APW11]|uniref:AarF/ABC1/UbiB kinase family protein n=1 Tax=Roseateles aquae TaxID=3077235 RepID=A0ABU3P7S4_9BURK|nr:AarF/ABC1/UbiB kinase family protein [Paucibacter sp. APW11]MDT8998626.1 AarF/ABC1/UbiB kinase family protein [Paucibacter sp. APW11]
MSAAGRAPRTGRLGRGLVAGGAVARAGLARLGHKMQDLSPGQAQDEATRERLQREREAELGRILFAALNQLKGVALKASQLLASEVQLLPPALREQLAQACYQATPMNQALVDKRMRQALGADWAERFADFEPQAFAAASLGQVHRARLHDGRQVALKLQYPGMAATVRSDMQLLRGLLLGPLGQRLIGDVDDTARAALQRVFDDIEHSLATELDYQQEAATQAELRERLQPLGLSVPAVWPELGNGQLLCSELMQGQHLGDWLATSPSQAERDRLGQLLFDSFWSMVFELRWLHADPHPGNFLFLPDGGLALLDFGCTRRLSASFVAHLGEAWNAVLRPAGEDALLAAYQALGLVDPAMTPDSFCQQLLPALRPLIDWQLEPFRHSHYDFSQRQPLPRLDAEQQRDAMRRLRGMPGELPFFDRAYLGLNQLLMRLGARVQTCNQWIRSP